MVIHMYTIKSIDKEATLKVVNTNNDAVVWDNNDVGELGSMVASVITESEHGINHKVLGFLDDFVIMGHAPFMYHKYSYDSDG